MSVRVHHHHERNGSPNMTKTDQAVVITGGTSGIGLATAGLLHEQGVSVMVTGRTEESVARARTQLPAEVIVTRADAASVEDNTRVAREAEAAFGSLTGAFLNAGIMESAPVESMSEDTWERLFAINAKGPFFALQKLLPLMGEGASVVFTVGIGARRGMPGGSAAAGSRGALLTMIPSLAVELAPRGIRVNAVSPGPIDTPILAKSGMGPEQIAAVKQSFADALPLRRMGRPEEVAETVAFLLSQRSSFITGEDILVGGGAGLNV